jgi:hypothetical protein
MRFVCSTFLLTCLLAGCDLSPTAIEAMDEGELRTLVARATPAGEGRTVWLNLLEDFDAAPSRVPRLPGLDSLFVLSMSAVMNGDGDASPRAEHRKLVDQAWLAIGRGDTEAGEDGLTAARSFQAQAVVESLGPGTPLIMITLTSRALERLQPRPGAPAEQQRRIRAMSLTARDLLADARQAVSRGEHALALDLATHAGGLVNSMQGLLRHN